MEHVDQQTIIGHSVDFCKCRHEIYRVATAQSFGMLKVLVVIYKVCMGMNCIALVPRVSPCI